MIKRTLFEGLKAHLSKKEMSLIVGPWQAGKTTLMLLCKEYLEKEGEETLFLSLDFESDRPFFSSQRELISKIQLELGTKKGFIFIDEIQRKEDAGLFLKGLYDMNLPYKFIISGSGSLELKEKLHESLSGRKRIFELNTLSFREFVDFKTNYAYEKKLQDFFQIEKEKGNALLNEYMNFGGYPRIVLEAERKEKRRILDDIYRSYLEKDIVYLLRLEKSEALSSLLRIMASQIGKLVNYSELSSTLGIAHQTVKNYLWYAEKTFIIHKVSPYHVNIRKEITKSPVIYFLDLGLRNYLLGLFGNVASPLEFSFLFQNIVLLFLKEMLAFEPGDIYFWRTKDKAGVDFIVRIGNRIIPLEVKFTELKKPEVGRSLRSFITKYKPEEAWVINLGLEDRIKIEKTEVMFRAYHELA